MGYKKKKKLTNFEMRKLILSISAFALMSFMALHILIMSAFTWNYTAQAIVLATYMWAFFQCLDLREK